MVRAMKKKIKIIDLLNKIANGEEVPEKIKYYDNIFRKCDIGDDYFNDASYDWLFKDIFDPSIINDEVKILEDEEDKDIPLIPDDELYEISKYNPLDIKPNDEKMDYNFKVLKEKINQVVEEFNRRNNEEKFSNKD